MPCLIVVDNCLLFRVYNEYYSRVVAHNVVVNNNALLIDYSLQYRDLLWNKLLDIGINEIKI